MSNIVVSSVIHSLMQAADEKSARYAIGAKFHQMVFAETTDATVSVASLTFASFLTCDITPKSATSKILAIAWGAIGCSHAGWGGNLRISRGGTGISVGAAAGGRRQVGAGAWYSGGTAGLASGGIVVGIETSPGAGASVTYSFEVNTNNAAVTAWRNRTGTDADVSDGMRGRTTLVLLEIEP